MHAYDIMLGNWRHTRQHDNDGWCFGLPPGIAPEQWPLDPWSGYPMLHGFTLRLPEDYRVHGPDVVALAFFATAPDHNDGGPARGADGLPTVIAAPAALPPENTALRPFWERARLAHARLTRMQDILGCAYAVVLLRQDAFDGPLCPPPPLVDSTLLQQVAAPEWLTIGAARSCAATLGKDATTLDTPAVHAIHRPFHLVARANDPNAGKVPRQTWDGTIAEGGYQSPFREDFSYHAWTAGHAPNHLGGTMRPTQAMPEFSPYYIEFEENFGGYNFGSGNAQLDIKTLQFDWAC
ncbi:hypothetical protein [Xanthomonas sp. 3075]|uniref:hypothetical protein n=1 Tax=Xanthomonas sp. 3075 TaxID=3035315 RepID=UPI0016182A36|nr:hypothetical protein [Xanthomonas sp. 3075]MBB4133312.1 hypothetical protein [Xanthomonas sp. 3075]